MKKLFVIMIAVMLVFSCTSCAKMSENAEDAIVIAITKDENNLSPYTYVTSTGSVVNRLIYDTLFTTDTTNNIIPWMVEEDYEITDGFRAYSFTLVDGLRFQDGTPITTEDVAFSFTYQRDTSAIESIEIRDERSMCIRLKGTDMNFMRTDLVERRIVSKKQYENIADPATVAEPIGSGMYRLKEYKVGEYYILEENEYYFKGTPSIKTINMPIIEDPSAVQTALLSGEIAASTSSIGVEMVETFESKDGIELFIGAGYSPMMLNFNNERAPFDDAEFRKAMTYAIDAEGIMQTLYGPQYCTVGTRGIIRSDLQYAEGGLQYEYDPDKANAILDDAGYVFGDDGIRIDKNGEPCRIEILAYSGNAIRIRAAELSAEQLKKVGVAAEVRAMEMDTVDAYVWPDFDVSMGRDYDAAMWGWGTGIRPNFLTALFSDDPVTGNYNVCGYSNDEMQKVIDEDYAQAQTDDELFAALRAQQRIAAEDPALICFGYADSLQACNTDIYDGFRSGMGLNVVNIFSFLAD